MAYDLDPYSDFKELRFAGGNQKMVVHSVLQGAVDAGSVRTEMLEDMAGNGEISLSAVNVLRPKQVKGFSFLLSTDLLPGIAFFSGKKHPGGIEASGHPRLACHQDRS